MEINWFGMPLAVICFLVAILSHQLLTWDCLPEMLRIGNWFRSNRFVIIPIAGETSGVINLHTTTITFLQNIDRRASSLRSKFALLVGFRLYLLYSLQKSKTLTSQKKGFLNYVRWWALLKVWISPSLLLLSDPLWPGVVVPIRVLSVGQLEQFNHLLRFIIIINYLKPYNCVQII